jgi:hypothetical protein
MEQGGINSMNSLSYLKFDLRLTKDTMKYYIIILIAYIALMMFMNSYAFSLRYMFFILVLLARIPFNIQGNEKSLQMYYMFPAKISSMVLGRLLYLILLEATVFIINGIIMIVLYKVNEFNSLKILSICFSGILSMIVCFIQYPLYYKFEYEKGKIVSNLIAFVPAFLILSMPDYLGDVTQNMQLFQYFDMNLILPIIGFIILITMLFGFISYSSSCKICKRKEV